jgi:hypothetical protein
METRKRRIVTKTPEKQMLSIEDGKVVANVIPAEVVEVDLPDDADEEGKLRISFSTPQGDAVYEYVCDCVDCQNKRPPVVTPVFKCISGEVRADEQVGNQLAAFRRDGHASSAICKDCYTVWRGQQPKREARFKVL